MAANPYCRLWAKAHHQFQAVAESNASECWLVLAGTGGPRCVKKCNVMYRRVLLASSKESRSLYKDTIQFRYLRMTFEFAVSEIKKAQPFSHHPI